MDTDRDIGRMTMWRRQTLEQCSHEPSNTGVPRG